MLANCSPKLLVLIVPLFAIAPASCGRENSGRSITGYTRIDTMEGEGGHIEWSSPDGLPSGFWTSTTDCSQASQILPEPYFRDPAGWTYDRVPVPYQTMPGMPLSTRAAHLRTKLNQPLHGVWGANMGFDFVELPGASEPSAVSLDAGTSAGGTACRQGSSRDFKSAPVDLSAYAGFTFWAMAEPTGRQTIRVQINNMHSDPRGELCTSGDPSDPKYEKLCYNGYGKALMLTSTFTQYWVQFSDMRQDPGWGYEPSQDPFQPETGAFSMNFEVPLPGCVTDEIANCAGGQAPVSFDIWIDDLYFVNRP